jgi:coenzyme F420-dependent glucose-6-phosphate dehydrogenase
MQLGYWLSSEEHPPRTLVENAVLAEQEGFGLAMLSDHIHPWVRAQGHAPFAWAVLGAIAQATTSIHVGSGVSAPGRMHPVVLAHATATASVLFEGRFFLGIGSGERLNEHVTGERWPPAPERLRRLEEAIELIKQLLGGGMQSHRGDHFTAEDVELFDRTLVAPDVIVAASGGTSAAVAGRAGDGLLSVMPSAETVEAFEAAGGEGKPRIGQLHVCWAKDVDEARRTVARWWPNGALQGAALSDLARPRDFEQIVDVLPDQAIVGDVVCGPDLDLHFRAIARYAAAGYDHVVVHQIGPDQRGFVGAYAANVLPCVR